MAKNYRKQISYSDAGVDIAEGKAIVEAIKPLVGSTIRPGVDGKIGGFAGAFDLKALASYRDPVLLAATDSVGTKLKIAIATGCHHSVGIDLVAMSVNDLVAQGGEPLFFLDYFASAKLERKIIVEVIAGIADGCKQAGCGLIGGETAELPGLYRSGDYDAVGFGVGVVERDHLLPTKAIGVGDVVIGLASSGLHSNGFSLVRKLVALTGLSWADPAPFAPSLSLGVAMQVATTIYVKPVLAALKRFSPSIKALAHITGGGLMENIPRVLVKGLTCVIDCRQLRPNPAMKWLSEVGAIERDEMLTTFNCGIGMIIIASVQSAGAIMEFCQQYPGYAPRIIGEVIDGDRMVFNGELF